MQAEEEKTEAEIAADRRRALRTSLERERDGYATRKLDDRVAQVEEQIRLLDEDGDGEPGDAEEREEPAPKETAVETKPRSTAGRGAGRGK